MGGQGMGGRWGTCAGGTEGEENNKGCAVDSNQVQRM